MPFALLQGHAILEDVIPSCLIFDGNNHLALYFGPHVSLLNATWYAINDMFY